MDVYELKADLRKRMLAKLKTIDAHTAESKQGELWDRYQELAAFNQANVVCCYVALPYEVQTRKLIENLLKQQKRVIIPYTREDAQLDLFEIRDPELDTARGRYGIPEPVERIRSGLPVAPSELDAVVVPGLAFDRKGYRLGRGKGYYDRFLSNLSPAAVSVGLAYDFQLLDHIPVEAHDLPVNNVIVI